MSKSKLKPAERAWLAKFTPVDEKTLTDSAADFLARIRALFRRAKVGKKNGHLEFYMIDKVAGPFSGSFPPWCTPPDNRQPKPDFK